MLQMMALMRCVWEEQLCESDVKMLQLANFRVLAITPRAGYVKFVPDAVDLSQALHQSQGDLVSWLARNHADGVTVDEVMDNFCGSVAASTVVTYVLGIGDRHLENIMLTRRGQLFHVDFSFVLGDDPKPMAPQCRFPQQVAQALLRTNRLSKCFALAGEPTLRSDHLQDCGDLCCSSPLLLAVLGVRSSRSSLAPLWQACMSASVSTRWTRSVHSPSFCPSCARVPRVWPRSS